MDGERALLPVDDDDHDSFEAELSRWWVLVIFSLTSGFQGLAWFTYSSVPMQSKEYLHIEDSELNLILNEGD